MKDERYWPVLGTWLKDTATTPPDPQQTVRKVAERIPQTPQVRRRRWLPPWSLGAAKPLTTEDAIPQQPMSIPASNGHSPTVTGRTRSMLSPAKAITAGALVFALGGAFLIAQPLGQHGASAPGAEAPIAQPVEVTGHFMDGYGSASPDVGDIETLPGVSWVFTNSGRVSASDPRLEGTTDIISQEQMFIGNGLETSERLTAACETDSDCTDYGEPYLWLSRGAESIENDEGVWRQRPRVSAYFPGSADSVAESRTWVDVYDGEGAYDGLIAVLEFVDSGVPCRSTASSSTPASCLPCPRTPRRSSPASQASGPSVLGLRDRFSVLPSGRPPPRRWQRRPASITPSPVCVAMPARSRGMVSHEIGRRGWRLAP